MVDENVDRVHVPGQQPMPERDIEPLWPPDQIGGTDTPPWASTASPPSPVPPQGRPGHPPSPADYPSLTGGMPATGAGTTVPQGVGAGWSPPPAAHSGWEPDASAWAPPTAATQAPPTTPAGPGPVAPAGPGPTVPPASGPADPPVDATAPPGSDAAGPAVSGPAGDRRTAGVGGSLSEAAGGGVPAPRSPQTGPARVDLNMPFSLDHPAAPVPVASPHSQATARTVEGPGEPARGHAGRQDDPPPAAVAGIFSGGRPALPDPTPDPAGTTRADGVHPTVEAPTAHSPTTGGNEAGDPTTGGNGTGSPTTSGNGAGGGARMPAESPWAQPPQRPATTAVEPGPGPGAAGLAPAPQSAVPRQALLHHQSPAQRDPADQSPPQQNPAGQSPPQRDPAGQAPSPHAPPQNAAQGPVPHDPAGQGTPVGPATNLGADPAAQPDPGANVAAAQPDLGADPATAQQAAPPGPYPPQQAGPYPPQQAAPPGPYPPQQGGPPGPYPPRQASPPGPYPPQQGAPTPPGPYPPGWYPPTWQQAAPGAPAPDPQQAYQPAEGVTAVPPAQPDANWHPGITTPPTAEDFARRRQIRPADPVAAMGVRAVANRMGLRLAPGRHEQELRRDIETVRRNFGGLRQVTVVNPKGGAGKTVAILLLAMTFGQKRGGYVLAWDNNETQGTLGMRAQQDFHSRTVRDMLRDLGQFQARTGGWVTFAVRPLAG